MLQSLKNIYHLLQAVTANITFGFPASSMKVICVTGTDGKTTTSGLLYHILRSAGKKVALLTTVSAVIDGKSYETGAHVTTPSSFALQKYLKKAKQSKAEYFILEATSHGIDQNRIWGIPVTVGVLTNISHEHLDYHKTYERYVKAKTRMLKSAKTVVINRDDASYELVMDYLKKYKGKIMTYGMTKTARINMRNFPFSSKLLGTFNQYNCLAAAGALTVLGIDDRLIKKGIATFTPPIGRQQVVYNKLFRVMVDFAHTPNAFLQVLPAVKKITANRLIHIFGSAGLRDITKRPEMGKAASTYTDIIIITAEDPRGEPVEKIAEDIKTGIYGFTFLSTDKSEEMKKGGKYCFVVPNRKEAILFGVGLAQQGDTILMTGKSHEKSINYDGNLEEAWDEFAVAKEAVEKKYMVMHKDHFSFTLFDEYPFLANGYFTRIYGSVMLDSHPSIDTLTSIAMDLSLPVESIKLMNQTHGENVCVITKDSPQVSRDVDGLVTIQKGIFLGVKTADCLPIIFFDPEHEVIGVCHAGYKGLLANVIPNTLEKMERMGSKRKDILVGVGPSICDSCYTVEEERISLFRKKYPAMQNYYETRDAKHYLHLNNIASFILQNEGIMKEHTEFSPYCTKENVNLFFSRRTETSGVFLTGIGML